eukprot:5629808-Pyramimonas_sp.AAC.1
MLNHMMLLQKVLLLVQGVLLTDVMTPSERNEQPSLPVDDEGEGKTEATLLGELNTSELTAPTLATEVDEGSHDSSSVGMQLVL